MSDSSLTENISAKDHADGPLGAKAILLEYGDYECGYCGMAYPILKEVKKRMGDKVCFVFRNFPLNNTHPNAQIAAEAAEAAALQGKFWEMHDMLYENQNELEPGDLLKYAKKLGLDVERFKKDVSSSEIAAHIKHDFKSGLMSGVNGTPSIFINGERYDGERDVESILEALK